MTMATLQSSTMSSEDVSALFSDFWDWRLKQSPEFATMVGDKRFNDVLEQFTEQRFEADLASCEQFLERAASLMEGAVGPDRDNLEFFQAEVGTFVEGFSHRGFYYPINYMEGVQVDFQRLAEWATLSEVKDYQDLVARYHLFPTYAGQIVTVMRAAVSKGLTNHEASMKGVVGACRAHLEGAVEETAFYKPFLTVQEVVGQEAGARLQGAAKEAIQEGVRSGFRQLGDFLEQEYLPACRKEIAASSLPGGEELYKACLRFHTSTAMTAQQIHDKGLEEVARIEDRMRLIMASLGLQCSLPEFILQLREDPANFFSSAEELLAAFDTIIRQKTEPQITKIFRRAPTGVLEITSTPQADYPAAFYIAGTPDGARPSKLFVNTFKFSSQPRYELVSLALHEAIPGHHLQGDYIQQDGWPDFRKIMEDRAYSQAPTRFPINTAYVEGWGLYSETLGHDLGLYSEPMDRYGL